MAAAQAATSPPSSAPCCVRFEAAWRSPAIPAHQPGAASAPRSDGPQSSRRTSSVKHQPAGSAADAAMGEQRQQSMPSALSKISFRPAPHTTWLKVPLRFRGHQCRNRQLLGRLIRHAVAATCAAPPLRIPVIRATFGRFTVPPACRGCGKPARNHRAFGTTIPAPAIAPTADREGLSTVLAFTRPKLHLARGRELDSGPSKSQSLSHETMRLHPLGDLAVPRSPVSLTPAESLRSERSPRQLPTTEGLRELRSLRHARPPPDPGPLIRSDPDLGDSGETGSQKGRW